MTEKKDRNPTSPAAQAALDTAKNAVIPIKIEKNARFVMVEWRGHKIYKCLRCPFNCQDDEKLMERHQREIHQEKHQGFIDMTDSKSSDITLVAPEKGE